MNILYISHLHPPEEAPLENMGGMQRVSMQLVRELRRRDGVRLHADVLESSWKNIALNSIVFLLEQLFRLPRMARETEADVILFSSMVTAALARLVRGRVDVPMVAITHGQDVTRPNPLYQRYLPGVFQSLDGVISVSRATRQACIDRGMDPERGVALSNGVDLDTMRDFPGRPAARHRMEKLTGTELGGRPMLLTVGRMVERKGHEWFIREVLPSVRRDAVWVAVGDGPRFDSVRAAAMDSDERDRIFLLGRQPDEVLKMAYSAADLFVMPNIPVEGDMEGFGIVMLEANMSRTPVVASDLEGIKDVIADGENGYRVTPLAGGRFAERVNEVLSEEKGKLGERARAWVLEQFSWDRVAESYLEYLEKVVARSRKGG